MDYPPRSSSHSYSRSYSSADVYSPRYSSSGAGIQHQQQQGSMAGVNPSPPEGSPMLNTDSNASLGTYNDDSTYWQHPARRDSSGAPMLSPNQAAAGTDYSSYRPTPSRLSSMPTEKYEPSDVGEDGRGAYGAVPTLGSAAAGGKLKRRSGSGAGAYGGGASGKARGGGFGGWWHSKSGKVKGLLIAALVAALVILAIVIAVPVAVESRKSDAVSANQEDKSDGSADSIQTGDVNSDGVPDALPTGNDPEVDWRTSAWGGNGSTVYADDGSTFIYNNTFGGYWVSIPFNNTARAQSYSPALDEEWNYETDVMYGVNIGGWLALEPFISAAMFEPYASESIDPTYNHTVVDEWTLCEAMGDDKYDLLEEHYSTFITEKDFAEIAGAGLNWVRIPIGWWAIETWEGEPFVEGRSWYYFLKAVSWARKYGLRVLLDLHGVPGSQNGYNHSGKMGSINFLNGVMGVANAQRTLNYIRTLTEFISQDEYLPVVPMFGIMNEPYGASIGIDVLRHFYAKVYDMARGEITGTGTGNGPILAIHDGFSTRGVSVADGGWNGFMAGADRLAMDSHPYLCFSAPNNDSVEYQATKPCTYWADQFNSSIANFGITLGGEWSLAINDCGKWLNSIGNGARYDGTYFTPGTTDFPYEGVGNCDEWNDWESWDQARIDGLNLVARAHMDSMRNFFFWTWKTGYSNVEGKIVNPFWNYQLGLELGYVPSDPRTAYGVCGTVCDEFGIDFTYSAASLNPTATGGGDAGNLVAASYTPWSAWPPPSIGSPTSTPVDYLPTYTATGAIVTLSAVSPTSFPSGFPTTSTVNVGDGWFATSDVGGWETPVAGCSYPNPWSGVEADIPTAVCTGTAQRMRVKKSAAPAPTPAPTPAPIA